MPKNSKSDQNTLRQRILLAVAELKSDPDRNGKVNVAEVARRVGVARNTLYDPKYRGLLDDEVTASPEVQTEYLSKLNEANRRVAAAEKKLANYQAQMQAERESFIANTFSQMLLESDLPILESSTSQQELSGLRSQLNSRINEVKALSLEVSTLKSRCELLEQSGCKESPPFTVKEYHPEIADLVALPCKEWLDAYFSRCLDLCESISENTLTRNDGVVFVFHAFNYGESVVEDLNFPEGQYTIVYLATTNFQMRKMLIERIKESGIEMHAIVLQSTASTSKWFSRINRATVSPEVVTALSENMTVPMIDEGFKTVFIKDVRQG